MELATAIENIVKKFRKDDYFDSHSVINELLKKDYHQVYLESFPKNCTVAQYHGQIAQKIGESGVAEKVHIKEKDVLVKTHTVYGDLSENHLWIRI